MILKEDGMSVLQRARDSGKCPPSLLSEDRVVDEDGFDEAVLKVLDASGKKDFQRFRVARRFRVGAKTHSFSSTPFGNASFRVGTRLANCRRLCNTFTGKTKNARVLLIGRKSKFKMLR
jgi:hypothetical protein